MSVSTAVKLQKAIPVQSERVEAVGKAVAAKKTKAPVTVSDVAGKPDRVEELTVEIMGCFEVKSHYREQLYNLLKHYL